MDRQVLIESPHRPAARGAAWGAGVFCLLGGISAQAALLKTLDSEGNVGIETAIAIGADGKPIVSYYDGTGFQLKVAHCNDTRCVTGASVHVLDSAGDVGRWSSIAIGADGLPVVSYYGISGTELKVAHCADVDCSGAVSALAVDSAGTVGQFSSITMAADGLPIIAYTVGTYGASTPRVLKCSSADCSGSVTTVTGGAVGGQYTSIALGADGLAVVSYEADALGAFKVFKCANAACTSIGTDEVLFGTTGRVDSSIAIGLDGFPVVSYYPPSATTTLGVRRCASANCQTGLPTGGTVDATVADVGAYNDIAIGSDGIPIMSYWNVTGGTLKVAQCANAQCTGASKLTKVDGTATAVVGAYTSIAIGNDGLAVISYYDSTHGDLKVAKCDTLSCEADLQFQDGFE